ncbi:sugar phosphate isomerase/epimerase, partial [Candidatus Poribacteria bacterium]|nr:sugar phosphate isomerase/epimerase [Candidatus Poribacteria bacterium]
MVKYGINFLLWSGDFTKESIPFIKKAADMGFDGVEIPIFNPNTVDIEATKEALKANGM